MSRFIAAKVRSRSMVVGLPWMLSGSIANSAVGIDTGPSLIARLSIPHLYPPFSIVQSVGSRLPAAAAIESLYGAMPSAMRLSMVCATVFGGAMIGTGGVHSLPSEYDGFTPRDGPPPPTNGPLPPSSVGLTVVTAGAGITLGIIVGATTWIARETIGRPSPPTLPGVGFAPGVAMRT